MATSTRQEQELDRIISEIRSGRTSEFLRDAGINLPAVPQVGGVQPQGFISQALMQSNASGGLAEGLPLTATTGSLLGNISFYNKGQNKISTALNNALRGAAGALGVPLGITSGYRSPAHNRAVGGARNSLHMARTASDIDMSGLNAAQRQQLVSELAARGVTNFITYSKYPNMLHVDMRRQATISFMHNKTARSGKGLLPTTAFPSWIRAAVTSLRGKPVTTSKIAAAPATEEEAVTSYNVPNAVVRDAPLEDQMTQTGAIPTPTRAPERFGPPDDLGRTTGAIPTPTARPEQFGPPDDLGRTTGAIPTPTPSPLNATIDPQRFADVVQQTLGPDYTKLSPTLQAQLSTFMGRPEVIGRLPADTSVAPAPVDAVQRSNLPAQTQVMGDPRVNMAAGSLPAAAANNPATQSRFPGMGDWLDRMIAREDYQNTEDRMQRNFQSRIDGILNNAVEDNGFDPSRFNATEQRPTQDDMVAWSPTLNTMGIYDEAAGPFPARPEGLAAGMPAAFDPSRFDAGPINYAAISPTLNAPPAANPDAYASKDEGFDVPAQALAANEYDRMGQAVQPFTSLLPNNWPPSWAPPAPHPGDIRFVDLMRPGVPKELAGTLLGGVPTSPSELQTAVTTQQPQAPVPASQQPASLDERLSNLGVDMFGGYSPAQYNNLQAYGARQRDLARAVSDILGEAARDQAQSVYTATQAAASSAAPVPSGMMGRPDLGGAEWSSNNATLADAYKDASFDIPAAQPAQPAPQPLIDPVYTQPQMPAGSMQLPDLGTLSPVTTSPQVTAPAPAPAPVSVPAGDVRSVAPAPTGNYGYYDAMTGLQPDQWSGTEAFDSMGHNVNTDNMISGYINQPGTLSDQVSAALAPTVTQADMPASVNFGQATTNPVQDIIQRQQTFQQQTAPQQATSTSTPVNRAPTNQFTSYNLDYNSLPATGVYNGGINPETGRFEVQSTGNPSTRGRDALGLIGKAGMGYMTGGPLGAVLGLVTGLISAARTNPEAVSSFGQQIGQALGVSNAFSGTGPGGMFGGGAPSQMAGGGFGGIAPTNTSSWSGPNGIGGSRSTYSNGQSSVTNQYGVTTTFDRDGNQVSSDAFGGSSPSGGSSGGGFSWQ